MFYEEWLEKQAAKKSTGFGMDFGEVGNKDRQLIEQYKKATSSFEKNMIFNDIKRQFNPAINSCISNSGILNIMDRDDAQQVAEIELKNIIEKFDLTYTNKPSSYIIGRLDNELKREVYNNQNNVARRSSDLTMKNGFVVTAEQILKKMYNRQPSVDELHHYITKEMGRSIDKAEITRNHSLNRNILSGDQVIGTNSDSNAEVMTLMDLKNVERYRPEELQESQAKQDKIDKLLAANFSRPERKMIRNYYGLGEFKGKAINLNKAATNSMISYYEAKKVVDRFEKMLDEQHL